MKWDVNDEDTEDFEQEKAIQEWLKREGRATEFEYKHITNKGTARNTLIKAAISLDQEISDDGPSKFADLTAGCDGRDLECGPELDETPIGAREKIYGYLSALGFSGEETICLEKILKLSILENRSLLGKSAIDLEW